MTANLPGLVQSLQFRKGGGVKLVLINSGEYIYLQLTSYVITVQFRMFISIVFESFMEYWIHIDWEKESWFEIKELWLFFFLSPLISDKGVRTIRKNNHAFHYFKLISYYSNHLLSLHSSKDTLDGKHEQTKL
jgi:hypothetical protein